MVIPFFPFQIIDWNEITETKHIGESGFATWQVLQVGSIRVRKVVYSPGYKADHWCNKGHIIHCLSGEMETTLKDGRSYNLKNGNSYIVGDENEEHTSFTATGCTLFIVD